MPTMTTQRPPSVTTFLFARFATCGNAFALIFVSRLFGWLEEE
jgi:hypothetical protein